jgi:ribosome-associated protein
MNGPGDAGAGEIELGGGVRVPMGAIRIQFARSSGPGGQNVNKTSSKAELWLAVDALPIGENAKARLRQLGGRRITKAGELHVASDEHRTQERNRQEVFDRLGELIGRAMIEPKRRRKTKPSKAAKRKRLEGKRRRGVIKAGRRDRGDE